MVSNYYIYYKIDGIGGVENITKHNLGGNNNNCGCNDCCGYGGRQMNPPLDGGFVIDEYFWGWGNY